MISTEGGVSASVVSPPRYAYDQAGCLRDIRNIIVTLSRPTCWLIGVGRQKVGVR
jgi:hypothetical protein